MGRCAMQFCYDPHSNEDAIRITGSRNCPKLKVDLVGVAELTLAMVEAAALAENKAALVEVVDGPGGPKAAPVCTKGTVVFGEAGSAG